MADFSVLQLGLRPQQLAPGGLQDASGVQGQFSLATYDRQVAAAAHSVRQGSGGGGSSRLEESFKERDLRQDRQKAETDLLEAQTRKLYEERKQLALQGDYTRYAGSLKTENKQYSDAFLSQVRSMAANYMKNPAVAAQVSAPAGKKGGK